MCAHVSVFVCVCVCLCVCRNHFATCLRPWCAAARGARRGAVQNVAAPQRAGSTLDILRA